MAKKKSFRFALFTAILSLIVCLSMFAGTTFAWFTDSVTSANNVIKAGNLDIELKYSRIVEGKLTDWDTVQGKDNLFDKDALWEPGRVEVVYLEVSNLGSLDLKYQLGVNVVNETNGENIAGEELKLSDHLVFKVVDLDAKPTTPYTRTEAISTAGTVKGFKDYNGVTTHLEEKGTDYVALIVYMPESVGDEANYRGDDVPTIEFGVKLYATQLASEEDAFGKDYDEGANHPDFKVTTANDLQNALNEATAGEVIELENDIELPSSIVIPAAAATYSLRSTPAPVVIDLNGKTITTAFVEGSTTNHLYAIENHGNLLITGNGTINARGIFNYGNMVLANGTINAIDGNGGYAVRNYAGATFTMNGGKIATTLEDDNKVDEGGYDATTVRVDEGAIFVMNGGVIENICDYTFAIENRGETVINGGTATSVHSTISNYGDMTINGGSFTCNGIEGVTAHALVAWADSKTVINAGSFDGKDNYNGFNVDADTDAIVEIYGGNFLPVHSGSLYGNGTIKVYAGTFFDNVPATRIAEDAVVLNNADGTYTVVKNTSSSTMTLTDGAVLNLNGEEFLGTVVAEGDLTIMGDTKIKTLLATNGGTITVENGKTLTLNNFSFGAKSNNTAEYTITGGTITANYGFFQHGTYALYSNFETGYMYYSYGSNITVYGTFHSQGKGDGLDYVRGSLTIANGGKSIHDKSLWVGQPASWGAMNASLTVEEGGYVQANSLSVYEGSVAYNSVANDNVDTGIKCNSLSGKIGIICANTDQLVAAINAGVTDICLVSGDYALRFTNNTNFNLNGMTIKGLGDVNLAISSSEVWYGRVQGSNVTFENIHFTSSVGTTGKAIYNNCTFDSWAICASSNNEETTFNGCTINGCLNTSSDFSSGDVFVNNCEIAKAEYSGSMTMNFVDCQIGEVIIWNSNSNFTNCDITTLDDSNVTTAVITIK